MGPGNFRLRLDANRDRRMEALGSGSLIFGWEVGPVLGEFWVLLGGDEFGPLATLSGVGLSGGAVCYSGVNSHDSGMAIVWHGCCMMSTQIGSTMIVTRSTDHGVSRGLQAVCGSSSYQTWSLSCRWARGCLVVAVWFCWTGRS